MRIYSKLNLVVVYIIAMSLFLKVLSLEAQTNRNVLFLGNSYTSVNNLPQIIQNIALSAGDTLTYDSYTPGGFNLTTHNTNAISQSKIMAGNWDFIVLQEQSQEPILGPRAFQNAVYALNNKIQQYDPCAVPLLYMTWGRENGDAANCGSFPIMCTYDGMDSTIRNTYLIRTKSIFAEVSPVSIAWNYIRQNHPTINLYQADESHPSLEGSYAAACSFYASIFKKDPAFITNNYGLNATVASDIRSSVKATVFNNLSLWDFSRLPTSNFRYKRGAGLNEIDFSPPNNSAVETYLWDFGDGDTSTLPYVSHSYLVDGSYSVSLTTTNCDLQGIHTSISDTVIQFCSHTPTISISDSILCKKDTLFTEVANSYQWFSGGVSIPETRQYIAQYDQYMHANFSVMSTINTCSELSEEFTAQPTWSGYYLDGSPFGNPCLGDTVFLYVLRNGGLSGTEIIQWSKNDTILSFFANKDSLMITNGGIYECKIVDPNSNCPLDTTTFISEFNCIISNVIESKSNNLLGSLFPNPATENITITLNKQIENERIQIYSAVGQLMKEVKASQKVKINISDMPNGLYFIRLKDNNESYLKFIKVW